MQFVRGSCVFLEPGCEFFIQIFVVATERFCSNANGIGIEFVVGATDDVRNLFRDRGTQVREAALADSRQ